MIEYFDSELEEGRKNGYCLICKSEKCKHLVRWRNEHPSPATKEQLKRLGKGSRCIPVKRPKKPLAFPNGFKPKPITDEGVIQNEVSRKEKTGRGVETWDGFVGSYR